MFESFFVRFSANHGYNNDNNDNNDNNNNINNNNRNEKITTNNNVYIELLYIIICCT